MSPAFFSNDLLTEFLSLLPVKSLLRFKCVSNPWNILISDPSFVKFHLMKSKSQNPKFTLITKHHKTIKGVNPDGSDDRYEIDESIIPYPIPRLLDNPSFSLVADSHSLLNEKDYNIVGSCNGLICLADSRRRSSTDTHIEYWFRFWNPATRKISQKMGYFRDSAYFGFNFGCDNSTGTFKVVASSDNGDHLPYEVRVFSLADNVWRNIESFPVIPNRGVFFNGALHYFTLHNGFQCNISQCSNMNKVTAEHFVILSLDLGTETYHQYRLPRGFDELPSQEPAVGVLGDCLCFSSSYKETEFIIWQMKKFGDDESWTQFLKIRYHDLQLDYDFKEIRFVPLFLSKDGDTLVLYSNSSHERDAIIYNWRDNRVERTRVTVHKTSIDDGTYNFVDWYSAKGFVESLISIC